MGRDADVQIFVSDSRSSVSSTIRNGSISGSTSVASAGVSTGELSPMTPFSCTARITAARPRCANCSWSPSSVGFAGNAERR